MFVNKCTVLLAAGLARDALREVDAAVSTIERDRGSAARRAELLYSSALAAAATGDFSLAQRRSGEALRLFRRQQRPWWAARAELTLLLCRFAEGEDGSAPLLQAARRVTARLDELDAARAVDAHLLTGRLALARGRRDEAARHLRSAAAARHRGQLRTRSAGWLAQATWCEAEGRWRGMLAACDRGLALLDLHLRTLGATELRTLATANGAELVGMVLRHAVRRGDARMFLKWSERWRATGSRSPRCGRLPTATWWLASPPCAMSPPAWTARPTAGRRHPRCSGNDVGSRPPCASASCTPRRRPPGTPNPSSPPICSASWGTPTCWNLPTSTGSCTPSWSPGGGCTWSTWARPRQLSTRWIMRCSHCAAKVLAVGLTGSIWLPSACGSRRTCSASRSACFAVARWSSCRPEGCTRFPGA